MALATIPQDADKRVKYWADELGRARSRFRTFWDNGDSVVDAYRLQKADGADAPSKDKYNILYSSTETIRPNLYAQTPLPQVKLRNKDSASQSVRFGALLLEGCLKYVIDENDLDEIMDNCVEDYLLPGLGTAWVRYDANFSKDETGAEKLLDEMVCLEYGYWQDILTGVARTWKEVPWVAKRLWKNKEEAVKRFGAEKAGQLVYAVREAKGRESDNPAETAEIWEIWNKANRTVYWYAEGLADLLDEKPDPLKLKRFFPCPRPLRAITNTRTIVPRALYSQYKSQAETLNVLTKRIRLLGEALRVVGVYDGSITTLADILNPSAGNRMIAVDSWSAFAQNGGILGAVVWLPIDEVVKCLNELLKAREICKQEIYEITGFSDIVRGVSKASETLGAQNLKANWAGARVKKMQKEVQRFAKELIALAGEVIAEHCSPETIAVFSGIQIPTAEEAQANPERVQQFTAACDLLRNEMRRISTVDIETDSTLAADDEKDKAERAQFLAAAGAFLQQAVPAMEATPELGPLLGAMLMFTVRSFPSARIIEDEFERVTQAMANRKPEEDKGGEKAKAAADAQKVQAEQATKQQEIAAQAQADQATHQREVTEEINRHDEKMRELELKARELDLEERKLAIEERKVAAQEKLESFKAMHEAGMREQEFEAGREDAVRDENLEREGMEREDERADREEVLEREGMDREDENREADRDEAREAREAAEKAKDASQSGGGSDDA